MNARAVRTHSAVLPFLLTLTLAAVTASAETAMISLDITDATGASIVNLVDDNHLPNGADFLVNIDSTRTDGLATYSLRVGYDSGLILYRADSAFSGLASGFGKSIGTIVDDEVFSDIGADSYVAVSASGISGQTGAQTLAHLSFDIVGSFGEIGVVTVQDNPETTAPYADNLAQNLPHTSPGQSDSFVIGEGATAPTPTPPAAVSEAWRLYR